TRGLCFDRICQERSVGRVDIATVVVETLRLIAGIERRLLKLGRLDQLDIDQLGDHERESQQEEDAQPTNAATHQAPFPVLHGTHSTCSGITMKPSAFRRTFRSKGLLKKDPFGPCTANPWAALRGQSTSS